MSAWWMCFSVLIWVANLSCNVHATMVHIPFLIHDHDDLLCIYNITQIHIMVPNQFQLVSYSRDPLVLQAKFATPLIEESPTAALFAECHLDSAGSKSPQHRSTGAPEPRGPRNGVYHWVPLPGPAGPSVGSAISSSLPKIEMQNARSGANGHGSISP